MKQWPYKPIAPGVERPLLPVGLSNSYHGKPVRTFALVDSGSDHCHFDADFAIALGIHVEGGRSHSLGKRTPQAAFRSHPNMTIVSACNGVGT